MVKTVFKTGSGPRSSASFAIETRAGEYLFREGDLGTEMYIIQDGQVEILKSVDGKEQSLAVLEKGDFFGEMALLEDLPRTASARALGNCRLLQINGSTFDQMLRSNAEIAVRLMRKLSRRVRESDAQVALYRQRFGDATPPGPVASPSAAEEPLKALVARRLFHAETETTFELSGASESTVGRQDPVTGIDPDVDLTALDTQRSTSRRHAKIHRRSSKFFVTEEIGTTNGTFINGARLQTGIPFEIQVGDQVQFGLVRLDFRGD